MSFSPIVSIMHNLQHNKGFLEFVEAALKDKP